MAQIYFTPSIHLSNDLMKYVLRDSKLIFNSIWDLKPVPLYALIRVLDSVRDIQQERKEKFSQEIAGFRLEASSIGKKQDIVNVR